MKRARQKRRRRIAFRMKEIVEKVSELISEIDVIKFRNNYSRKEEKHRVNQIPQFFLV